MQTGGFSLFQPHSCMLDKQNRQLRRTTRSVIRLQFAHPNRLGTSQVTADTNLIAIQLFTVSSVSSLHPARSRKF